MFLLIALVFTGSAAIIPVDENTIDICSLPVNTGICRANMKSWSYNMIKQKCMPFRFGGCGGNGNNFANKKKCELACGRKLKKIEVNQVNKNKYNFVPECSGKCSKEQPNDISLDEPSLMNFREGKRAFPHSDLGSDNLYFNKK